MVVGIYVWREIPTIMSLENYQPPPYDEFLNTPLILEKIIAKTLIGSYGPVTTRTFFHFDFKKCNILICENWKK